MMVRPKRLDTSMQDSQDSTKALVQRGKQGDADALNRVFGRLMTGLRWWAHRRLSGVRQMSDTADIVQDAALGVWQRLDRVDLRQPGDLEAYVKRAVLNRIYDEGRRRMRQPDPITLDLDLALQEPSPLDRAIGNQSWEQCRSAFSRLSQDERDVIVARLEVGLSFEQIAELLERKSAAAARMAFTRAIAQLRANVTSPQPK
jgi:RNA polymerase sigma factor (sigma-70 family)